MAKDINVQMKQFNGVDFDNIFPKVKNSDAGAVIRTYPVASGYTITEGDVVDIVNGKVQSTYAASEELNVPNFPDVSWITADPTNLSKTMSCKLTDEITVFKSDDYFWVIKIIDSKMGANCKIGKRNTSETQDSGGMFRISDTKFFAFVSSSSSTLKYRIGTVNPNTLSISFSSDKSYSVSYGPKFTYSYNSTLGIGCGTNEYGQLWTFKFSSSSDTFTNMSKLGSDSSNYFSGMTENGSIFSSSGEVLRYYKYSNSSYASPVVCAISSSGSPNFGSTKIIIVNNTQAIHLYASGSVLNGVVCTAGSSSISRGEITSLGSYNTSFGYQSQNPMDYISSKDKNYIYIWISNYKDSSQEEIICIKVNKNSPTLSTSNVYRSNLMYDLAADYIIPLQNDSIIVGEDNGTNSLWEIKYCDGKSVNNGIYETSCKDAIALQSGSSGTSIDVIYSGVASIDWVKEEQIIKSSGVYGVGILDGVLEVWSKDRPENGSPIVIGSYIGTGKYGSYNKNSLTFNNNILALRIVMKGSDSLVVKCSNLIFINLTDKIAGTTMDWYDGNTEKTLSSYSFSLDKKTVSWVSSSDAASQANESGITYYYIAYLEV